MSAHPDHPEQAASLADAQAELNRLRRRLARERQARIEAEDIAEKGLRELYEKQQQLLLLESVAAAANQMTSVRELLQFAITEICQFTGWQIGHVYLADEALGGERLVSTSIWHFSEFSCHSPECHSNLRCSCVLSELPADLQQFCHVTEARHFEVGEGLPGRVLATGQADWIPKLTDSEYFLRGDFARSAGLASAFAFPVLASQEVTAVLEFFSQQNLAVDEALLRLTTQIGAQLGRVVERRRSESRLLHEAYHDPLTGLPNRALFLDWMERIISRSHRHPDSHFAVLFIDLDRFKLVNDSLGHLAGDDLLLQAASRIHTCLRKEDMLAYGESLPLRQPDGETHNPALDDGPLGRAALARTDSGSALARFGGDEFIALLDDLRDPSDAIRVAERIQEALKKRFVIEGQDVYTSASIGIVWNTPGYTTPHEILRDADLAMYRAKTMGKARSELFDTQMHTLAVKRLKLEADLRRALKHEEFVLHYQPIYELASREAVGFEALVRWLRPDSGLVYPDEFIGVAEDTGLILQLDMWVLREACRQIGVWHREFPREKPLTMSVNISARQFAQPGLVEQVREILVKAQIPPETLRLEITESASMSDVERTIRVLTEFKALGVRISIDDFGTGYSSLSYLHRFPLDVLKIDRSFVMNMHQNGESDQIVRTIMHLARNLGFAVVAEGTETEAHVEHLLALGCEYAQGYFFSRPLDLVKTLALLKAQQAPVLPA